MKILWWIYWRLNPWHARRFFERELKKAYLPGIAEHLEMSNPLLEMIRKK